MSKLYLKEQFVEKYSHENDKELETVAMEDTIFVGADAFRGCESLTDAYFGFDISRISHGAFIDCKSLKDVWFAIIDKDKIVEIAEDAFDGCNQDITFHIFGTAIDNKYLNSYARRHHFRVVGMM